MAEQTQLDRYIAGKPLTDELRVLAEGEEKETEQPPTAAAAVVGDITEYEREHLRRLKFEPGWPVVLKLMDREIRREEETAKQMSVHDPLGNAEKVAQSWAYVAMMRRSKMTLVSALESEIRTLEQADKKAGGRT